MRRVSIASVLLLSACAGTGSARMPAPEPVGSLAQLMRGMLFGNSNILYDLQTIDPDNPPEVDTSAGNATGRFANIYTGWQVYENAAAMLGEAANLLTIPGRLCENGEPVPLAQPDWAGLVQTLKDAAAIMVVATQARNREAAIAATDDITVACGDCHYAYRDYEPRCVPAPAQ